MPDLFTKLISPQGQAIYQVVKDRGPMTAKEIGTSLNIFPHAVYRASQQLVDLGFLSEKGKYPVTFQAKDATELPITFINGRDDLLKKTNADTEKAKHQVNFTVSGLEVPAETMLVYKQAIDRGVRIRAIVQRLDETSKKMFQNWKRMGLQIKYFPNMDARIFTFDKQIVCFTSYNPSQKDEATGMCFDYAPYAKLMDEIFEQRWKEGKEI